jgi:hypothetical protein
MGRKSKAKDRGYMTATEWRTEGGGFKEASKTDYKRLPFYCCAISFLPFEDAVRSCCAYGLSRAPQHCRLPIHNHLCR